MGRSTELAVDGFDTFAMGYSNCIHHSPVDPSSSTSSHLPLHVLYHLTVLPASRSQRSWQNRFVDFGKDYSLWKPSAASKR